MPCARSRAPASPCARPRASGCACRSPASRSSPPTPQSLEPYTAILRDELNVKAVALEQLDEGSLAGFGISRRLQVNARAAGPRIGKQVQQVIGAAKAGDWSVEGDGVVVGGVPLIEGEFTLELQLADAAAAVAFLPDGGFVVLDTAMTPELEAEGLARDVVRAVQQARKDAQLAVSDRIALTLGADSPATAAAIEQHRALIAGETLATTLTVVEAEGDGGTAVGSGASVTIEVVRA